MAARGAVATRADRAAHGKQARRRLPVADLAALPDRAGPADPVALLQTQDARRVPELVPIRYGRMLTSPFAFFRGAALVMASDLAAGESTGLRTQLCGDAHLSNFGLFASVDRRLVFDLNDFDETAPGPFEWDVKRLVASIEIAARENGFDARQRRGAVVTAAASYRLAVRELAGQTNLQVWYAHLDVEQLLRDYGPSLRARGRRSAEATVARARAHDHLRALGRLTSSSGDRPRIVADPPMVVPIEDVFPGTDGERIYAELDKVLHGYRRTLTSHRRHLLDQYELLQAARKVVGVGSVGTHCWILLLQGADGDDPLFLQVKEAGPSVLEAYGGATRHRQHGQRVVAGQLLMQSSSDIFLGWYRTGAEDGTPRDYYVRQLGDWKAAVPPDRMRPRTMRLYAQFCGWTLARAHARSGDRVALAAYLGGRDRFEQAMVEYARAYADRTERDHASLRAAVDAGRVTVATG